MGKIINTSKFINFLKILAVFFNNLYMNSFLSKVVSGFLILIKHSHLYSFIIEVIKRKQTFEYSYLYKLISKVAKLVDHPIGMINNCFVAGLTSSYAYKKFTLLKQQVTNNFNCSFLLFSGSFVFTYLMITIFSKNNDKKGLSFWILILVVFAIVYFRNFFLKSFKNGILGNCLLKIFK